ncbi:hypothetical protein DFQ30_001459 [Apophysomyces sp. BC1015]|nr:hypothetical protein DFQ30_001459 [Apophysomyces sp. BC1015]
MAIPTVIQSDNLGLNIFWMGQLWFVAVIHSQLPLASLSLRQCFWAHLGILLEKTTPGMEGQFFSTKLSTDVRLAGLLKIARGILKWEFGVFVIHPWLLDNPADLLLMPWLSQTALLQTLLVGIRIYCLLGSLDVAFGFLQMVLGMVLIDVFNSPILASGPKDFWSRRWNMIVRRLFHRFVFTSSQTQTTGWLASKSSRGLLVFFISGVFHEVIVMSICRVMTLENFAFFMLQGLGALVEVKIRQRKHYPEGLERVACIVLHLLFISLTGRLFVAPYLRLDIPSAII